TMGGLGNAADVASMMGALNDAADFLADKTTENSARELQQIPSNVTLVEPAENSGAEEVRRKLQETVPQVQFDRAPLNDVAKYLHDQTGLNIIVKWEALANSGIEPDKEATLPRIHGATQEKLPEQVPQ